MKDKQSKIRPWLGIAATVIVLAGLMLVTVKAKPIRPPGKLTDQITAPPAAGLEQATFAAGCFWSMEAIFKQLKGVTAVEPGYSGGSTPHPSYEYVEGGDTGYAETVNIIYDPKVISYRDLLTVLLTVRDPTTVNRQGNDEGAQYRSVIFYRTPEQKQEATAAIADFDARHVWPNAIVTKVQPFKSFWRAEDYHLDYYRLHPDQPYCRFVIAPEIAEFRTKFKDKLK